MNGSVEWSEVAGLLNALYAASDRLESIFPGRKFTLDGHLVGSVGEVIAAYMFDLDLVKASSKAHDATTRSGKRVEIKFTQGSSIGIRHEPHHLVVLQRLKDGPVRIVFNGPGNAAWNAAGAMHSNGQRPIGLKKLAELDRVIDIASRLPVVRDAPV
jgi:hypothetical protein